MDLYLLPIYGADIVLGVQWLAGLGPILFDYRELYMRFFFEGAQVTLHGLKRVPLAQMSVAQLRREGHTDAIASFFQLSMHSLSESSQSHTIESPNSSLAAALQALLDRFASVFDSPQGLYPQRNFVHRIPLLPYTAPVNVRPYRYPHF